MDAVEPPVEHAAMRAPGGWPGRLAGALAVALSGYAIYWVLFIVQPQVYRVSFLLIALILTFLWFPATRRSGDGRVAPWDWAAVVAALVAFAWPLVDFSRFVYRAAEPLPVDIALGAVAIVLVLEATRRAVGWVLPAVAIAFLFYAWQGPIFDAVGLSLIAHRGYDPSRLVGTLYMTLEGIFGVPLDVTATYIILFTIYGAVLDLSGAGRFFIDWAMSASGRSASAPARSVTIAGFLLGTVSGSGVATTVMLGSVSWPLLRRAGYARDTAGGMLSAAGIGALLSPPTLGAAAFLIAEFLQISYLQVLVMATVPTVLYYLSIFLMIEGDAPREQGTPGVRASGQPTASHGFDPEAEHAGRGAAVNRGPSARRYYHFTSLVAIAGFMASGMSAFRAVFWSSVLAVALSFLDRSTALTPRRLLEALRVGGRDVLGVAATTATAGIIVGVVTLTGLGLKLSGLIVALAGGTLVLTVIYSALAVWLLGLAVPVTASYIIAAVMVAPALIQAGVPDFAAHMFIFYYAVLSEVSPPTALSPFAAAALTGGNPFKTMLVTWKYTLPAFVVPFVFTLKPGGTGLLMHGSVLSIAWSSLVCAAGIAVLAPSLTGRMGGDLGLPARAALTLAGGAILFGTNLYAGGGALTAGLVLILHHRRHSRPTGFQ